MHERHENEQYFFDAPTLAHLTTFISRFERPCLVCAPMLGRTLAESGKAVTVLDVDERFSDVAGFRRWDLHRPQWLAEPFDLIVCDPPFFNVSLSRLFAAIRSLAHNRFDQPLLVSYLRRRQEAILGTFAPFGLEPTGYCPSYVSVQKAERNDIEFLGNLQPELHAILRRPATA